MFTLKAFLFLITICVAKSEEDFKTRCKNDFRDQNNKTIDVPYFCSNKVCIEKCCGKDEMIVGDDTCRLNKVVFNRFKNEHPDLETQYHSINILSSRDKNKKMNREVVFLRNNRKFKPCTGEHTIGVDYEILKDGSLSKQVKPGSKKWKTIKKLKYCIDYKIVNQSDIKVAIRQNLADPKDEAKVEIFQISGVLISSFFLLLVLVVYCLLPDLRNLSGLVLMAYTFSLLFAYITKLVLIFGSKHPPLGFCKKITPVMYYASMSSIFWLSVISFDVWCGLRGFSLKRDANRRVELVKFLRYSLFAWGTPLLITAIVTILDNIDDLDFIEPSFDQCFVSGIPFDVYFKIPIGILIFINIILFCMTVYNIRKVKLAVSKVCQTDKKLQTSSLNSTYAKLFVLMGVSWCLELFPSSNNIYLNILLNAYNLLIGVVIFYLYVFKKRVLLLLCKKFNIFKELTRKLEMESTQNTKSTSTRITRAFSSIVKNKPKDLSPETDLLQKCPKAEVP